MLPLPLITEQHDLSGKRVLLRVDFNVPLEGGVVRDRYRIDQSLATINFLRTSGARTVLLSHIGKGGFDDTLLPVANVLKEKFPVTFLDSLMSADNLRAVNAMKNGDVVLLENLRHNPGEETNDLEFASRLASLGDIYVNDAFAVSHRAHASTVGVPALLPSFAGTLLAEEVKNLSLALSPKRPFLFILGGAKIGTKMPLLKKFLNSADHVFLGGVMANNFLKAAGHEIGESVYDKEELGGLTELLSNERLIIPSDVVVKNSSGKTARDVGDVAPEDMIVDIGENTINKLGAVIKEAALIVWNGPLGYYEAGFTEGTEHLLSLIAKSKATTILGGGDTVALVNKAGFHDRLSFVSTGGGAMLDFLSNETLPGIDALIKK